MKFCARRVYRPLFVGLLILSPSIGAPSAVAANGAVREFEITAKKFEFMPARLEVTEGETVRLIVRSADSTHGLAIKKLKVAREIPKTGEPVTIEFVASKAGEFDITCSEWCGKGHKTMKGVLVVRPRAGTR